MKATLLSSLPPIKGISKYTAGLLGGFSKNGGTEIEALGFKNIYPEFLYPGGTKDDSLKPINLPNVRTRRFITWYNPLGWIYAGLTAKGEVLHAQWWSYALAPVYLTVLGIARYIGRKKIVITIHNVKPHEQGAIKDFANRSVLKLADHFIVHSRSNKIKLSELQNVSADRISVVPHGIILPDEISDMTALAARKELGIPAKAKTILFFGTIREYKGLDILLESLALISKEIPDVKLVIAGKPWEDWEKYQSIIDRHNIKSYLRADLEFISEEDIEKYFKVADIAVFPYKDFDSQSGAGSLALAFSKAIVVSDVGGLAELVNDPRALSRANDPEDLALKMAGILNDNKLQKKLENDSAKLAKKLSWTDISKQTLNVYKKLV